MHSALPHADPARASVQCFTLHLPSHTSYDRLEAIASRLEAPPEASNAKKKTINHCALRCFPRRPFSRRQLSAINGLWSQDSSLGATPLLDQGLLKAKQARGATQTLLRWCHADARHQRLVKGTALGPTLSEQKGTTHPMSMGPSLVRSDRAPTAPTETGPRPRPFNRGNRSRCIPFPVTVDDDG